MLAFKGKVLRHLVGFSHSLDRARNHLKRFDEGNYEYLFYAALELRMGLENRLYDYISASIKDNKKFSKQIKEYSASKLLKILSEIDPNALIPASLAIYPMGKEPGFLKEFIPIMKKHAEYYGKLNALLHYKFFRDNDFWFLNERTNNKSHPKTLLDYRDFLEEVLKEFEILNEGTLTAHPIIRFEKIFSDLDEDDDKRNRQ